MANKQISAQDLLDQLLSAGRDIAAQGRAAAEKASKNLPKSAKDVSAKGKKLAAKGEDYLVDKLGIEDSEKGRDALRKGAAAGAAAGGLALLLSSRSGRKLAAIGGLAGLGTLAYKAYTKNGGKIPKNLADLSGILKGEAAETRAETILVAMIAAARADGHITPAEQALIDAHANGGEELLRQALAHPSDAASIAKLADSEQAAREIYAASARIANGLNAAERDYLDALAMGLKLDPELAARLETDVRTG